MANAVLLSFCQRFEAGSFPDLNDSTSLWQLLARLTLCKVADECRRASAERRGGKFRRLTGGQEDIDVLAELASDELDPSLAVERKDLLEWLLGLLTPRLRQAALWQMQDGLTNQAIAERLTVSLTTVEELFRTIREEWATALVR